MASAKQIAANQENATHSTGPKTLEGKNVSKFNALTHGLAAKSPTLPHESKAAYELTRAGLYADFQPVGAYEEMLVDQIAISNWRLVRSGRVETNMMDIYIHTMKQKKGKDLAPSNDDDAALGFGFACATKKELDNWFRYQTHAERAFYKAGDALQKAQAARRRKEREESNQAKAHADTIAVPSNTPPPPRKMGSFRATEVREFPQPTQHFAVPSTLEDPHR